MRARPALLVLLAVLSAPTLASADQSNRFWLMYEQGNAAAGQAEYGKALQLYKAAIEGAGIFPEAEAAVGDIYLEEGEPALAQKQYEKAYSLRKSFYIPEMQYQILYKLGNLFEIQQQYKQMEDTLGRIVSEDRHFQETASQRVRTQVEKVFAEKGLERVLVLYTFDDTFSAAAHSKLGWFYYRTGRFGPAVSQLLFSVIYRASEIKKAMLERDVDYEFSTLTDMLAAVDKTADMSSYASSSGFYKDLYYLAGAIFANGLPRHALTIWKALSIVPSAGQYRDLSLRQLRKPFVEPLLSVTK
jgi:tetratricopeptide (TPR) repeat protein